MTPTYRRTLAAVVLAGLLAAGCGSSASTLPAEFTAISVDQATSIIDTYAGDGFVLLDVRTPEEFGQGHLEGAVNLDFYAPEFADAIAALDRDDRYLVYCRSGNRSATTLQLMEQLGFTEVHHLDGGINRWASEGGAVVP